jgi:hypothetical protein
LVGLVKMGGKDSSAHAGPRIGRALELARKERGLSLKQVEQATKIRARYLRELECENFDVLPAVYVQGSLKTYSNFLRLDGEALVRELRRRRASRHEPQGPAYVVPQKGDYFDRSLIFPRSAAGTEGEEMTDDEEDVGAAPGPAGGNLIYLASAAFLVLVAVALALTLPEDSEPAVPQVRKPLISQGPSQVSRVGGEENARPQLEDDRQSASAKNDNRQPEQHAGPSDVDTGGDGGPWRTGQTQGGRYLVAQSPRAALATQSASPAPQTEPATAPPEAPSTPPPPGAPDQGNQKQPATAPPGAASTPPPAEAPAQRDATGVPVKRGGEVPPQNARGWGDTRSATPRSQDVGGFDVRIVPGSDDPVRITGDPLATGNPARAGTANGPAYLPGSGSESGPAPRR